MKKLISRRNFLKVCALAGSAAALSACGGGKSTGGSNSAAAAVDVTGAVTFPLSEKVTFTGMTSFPVGSEPEPNNRTIFKRLEEQTNVHIDWTAIQSDQWSDKITLNMSNPNTLTDFVFTADFTDSNLLRYADQGVILNLEDYIDNNMPYLQKVFEQYPEYRTMCTDSDGHIWALPWIEQLGAEKTAIQTIGNMSFINTKWLNFLGLSMPTTVDEFEQVLMAFRDNAASLKAEYGIDGDIIPMSCIVNNGDQDPSILINGFGEGYGDAEGFNIFELSTNDKGEPMLKHAPLGDASPVEVREAQCVSGPLAVLDDYYGVYVTCPDDAQYRLDWIKEIYTPDMNNDYVYPNVFMSNEDTEQVSNLQADLQTYMNTQKANWIMNGTTDAEWNEYLSKLEAYGLSDYLGIMQKYLDAYYA